MTKKTLPFVSVIIPVYNDLPRLKLALAALYEQTYPSSRLEIIVIDNGSEDKILESDLDGKNVNLLYEETPGSYAARNKGVLNAKGDILAFTDSDCIPAPNWVEAGVGSLLSAPECGLAAGKIKVFPRQANKPNWIEAYDQLTAFPQQKYVEVDHYGVTANIFTFSHVFKSVGLFNAQLKSGGDSEWGQRVFKHGYPLVFAPDACVQHPARTSLRQLYTRSARKVGGVYDKKRAHRSWYRKIGGLIVYFLPPVRKIGRLWSDKRIPGIWSKLQFSLLLLFVHYAFFLERLRLTFGGKSRRE